MGYPALPDRAMLYHADGTIVKVVDVANGVVHHFTAAEMKDLNDYQYGADVVFLNIPPGRFPDHYVMFHFPEKRLVTGLFALFHVQNNGWPKGPTDIEGSNDTTNGLDGTWIAASAPDGFNADADAFDQWRKDIRAIDFGGQAFSTIRIRTTKNEGTSAGWGWGVAVVHLYGHKASGETPDDILFVDPATGNELALPLNFGAVPAGSSKYDQFALKNASASLTAQNITISVDDPDDIIRISWNSTGPWELNLTISSLAPGAQSATIYVKAEGPAPPTPLKPHRAPIIVDVGAWV